MGWKQIRDEAKKFLRVDLYGDPGVGKTIIGFLFPNVAIIPIEQGHVHYRTDFDFVELVPPNGKWTFDFILQEIKKLQNPANHPIIPSTGKKIETLVVDSISGILAGVTGIIVDEQRAKIARSQRKNKDDLARKDWGEMIAKFESLLNALEAIPLNVVVLGRLKYDSEHDSTSQYAHSSTDYIFDMFLELRHGEGKTRTIHVLKDRTKHYPRHFQMDNPTWDNFFKPVLKDLQKGGKKLELKGATREPVSKKDEVKKHVVKDEEKPKKKPGKTSSKKKTAASKKKETDSTEDKLKTGVEDYWLVDINYGKDAATKFYLPKEYNRKAFLMKVMNQKTAKKPDAAMVKLAEHLSKMLKGKNLISIPTKDVDAIWEMLIENNPMITISQAE